jgi:hypothetical protein
MIYNEFYELELPTTMIAGAINVATGAPIQIFLL